MASNMVPRWPNVVPRCPQDSPTPPSAALPSSLVGGQKPSTALSPPKVQRSLVVFSRLVRARGPRHVLRTSLVPPLPLAPFRSSAVLPNYLSLGQRGAKVKGGGFRTACSWQFPVPPSPSPRAIGCCLVKWELPHQDHYLRGPTVQSHTHTPPRPAAPGWARPRRQHRLPTRSPLWRRPLSSALAPWPGM